MFREFEKQDVDIVLGKFIAFMDKVLQNKQIDYLRHQKFLLQNESYLNQEEWEVLSVEDDKSRSSFSLEFENLYEIFEDDNVARAFEKLTESQQKVLEWNVVKDVPMTEIAKLLKVSASSVQKIKLRAMKSLKKYLKEARDDKEN